jgi:hypothetical protein
MRRLAVAGLVLVCACGGSSMSPSSSSPSSLTLVTAGSSGDGSSRTPLTIGAGETKSFALLVVGLDASAATLRAEGLPAFATLTGFTLTLSPTADDTGTYTFSITASAGNETARGRFTLTVAKGTLSCGPGTMQVGEQCLPTSGAPDPLIGVWSAPNGQQCTFVSGGAWDCFWHDGWPSTWSRMSDDTYFFGISNGPPCTGKATFSDDGTRVTLILTGAYPGQVFCDGKTPVTLVRKQ